MRVEKWIDSMIISERIFKILKDKNKGFNKDFVNEQPRFTFRLNLDDDFENIYANMHATTRKILNKNK